MRFTVPQFIEHEAKIVGPLTFKQFIFIGIAGTICFVLYFSLGKSNFLLFLLLSIILLIGAALFAFLQVGGRGLPTILGNLLRFKLGSKVFLWKKKETLVTVFKKGEVKKELKEETPLKISENSRLKKLRTEVETKTK